MSGRIGGGDRYATAALVAEAFAADLPAGAVPGVVVASGEDAAGGIDALSATFLAGHVGAPVLLTARDRLPAPTRDAAAALLGGSGGGSGGGSSAGAGAGAGAGRTVHVMGGPAVVADAVLDHLRELLPGAQVVRVQGGDRYATAAAAARLGAASIAPRALLAGSPAARTALVASGTNPADGLSAGPLAYAGRVPLLLTARDALPDATRSALRDLGIAQVVVLGGSAVVSSRVLDALAADGLEVVVAAGATRYDTAAVLLALASAPQAGAGAATGPGGVAGFGLGFADAAQGYLVNGVRFPDALASGPLAGSRQRPLYLTAPSGLSGETAGALAATATSSVTAIGLAGAVPDAVLEAADAAARA
ncbi:cell wall-binding repeat-containing protein [Quadrisphaera sp. DSM 44207]|uniref:cell wall-binding repeat-containing protein n=1 Tax=Quadrisphaera sp. DSM 44207 TaxID=1881057 RepID=UPI00088A2A4F|nr:cell wall-binding repeat-containing protein [Quadrisphaera sp. DSM 44207]SDQ10064.1 Putative cell wall binding repeat 2 [Quadrisphaera sp. DSM 44207]